MLLLYPPIAKPCEPPAGITQLAGSLKTHGVRCNAIDLNIEAILHLLKRPHNADDTWSLRAIKNLDRNLDTIGTPDLYSQPDRYRKVVLELNRLLSISTQNTLSLSLSNYQDQQLSPLASRDLLQMAAQPERCPFTPFFRQRLQQLFTTNQPRCIGISLIFLSQALSAFALIGTIRQILPEATIIVGGGLMTSWMRSASWQSPFAGLIDHCVDGCGEEFLLSLASRTRTVHGIPDYASVASNRYLAPGFILPYSTSSGCFWSKCSFCPERAERTPFVNKASALITEEVKSLVAEHTPSLIHFLDNAIPPATLRQLAHTPPGRPWYGFVRVSRQLLERDFCFALRRSGCVMLKLGIESGDDEVLEQMSKGITTAYVTSVLANLYQAGIATYIYILFGTPFEDLEKARRTVSFISRHQQEISFLNLAIFNMPRASSSEPYRPKDPDDLSLYTDFEHPKGWNRRQVRNFLDRECKRTPEIADILKRTPPLFTSNHAPFLLMDS